MLVICSGCDAKIKAPDKVAGKRVKCPKCATIILVPALESEAPTGSVTTASKPSGKKPPPLPTTRDSGRADDDEEDDEPEPPRSRRRGDDDDDDDDEPRKKHRRRDSVDDDDGAHFGIRRRKKKRRSVSLMGIASMIVGLGSLLLLCPGTCIVGNVFSSIFPLFIVPPMALVAAIIGIILGHFGKKRSPGFAYTGIVCGYLVVVFVVLWGAFIIIHLVMPFPGGQRILGPRANISAPAWSRFDKPARIV